jgi:tRNA G18 (ribose-2'-O)-methylase SpoU
MIRLNSHQIRKSKIGDSLNLQKQIKRNPIILVLDNVLDTYNIGSFFRLADALAAKKICLCGSVITPPNIKIHRASVGTWKWIPWEQYQTTKECIIQLKKEGYQIVGCEQTKDSINYQSAKYNFPVAIIAGSETLGISKDVLKLVDKVVEIPMFGVNISLNVLVATSIISFDIVSKLVNKKA